MFRTKLMSKWGDLKFTVALALYNHRPFKHCCHPAWIRFLWICGVRPY